MTLLKGAQDQGFSDKRANPAVQSWQVSLYERCFLCCQDFAGSVLPAAICLCSLCGLDMQPLLHNSAVCMPALRPLRCLLSFMSALSEPVL